MKFISALVMILVLPAVAQETKKEKRQAATERMVEGTVSDADDAFVAGAVVQLKDSRTLQVRSFITLDSGAYHFSGLKVDNDYQLKADYKGSTSGWKTLSIFDTRKTPVINLKLEKKSSEKKPSESKQ